MSISTSPKYKMPAEWAPHSATWLAWPYDEETFPDRVEKVEMALAYIVNALNKCELVELLVLDEEMMLRASEVIHSAGTDPSEINFHITEYADIWLRDSGPIFVKNSKGEIVISNWQFNAWGNKFPELLIDGDIPEKVTQWTNIPSVNADLVLEGGAIEINGAGTCLTTEQCLQNKNRNPGMSKEDIEKFLYDNLGITKTVWLKEGLTNDHTDGHIDELARFVSENKIVCAYEENSEDENYQILQDNYRKLLNSSDSNGNPFNIVKLPMPHLWYEDGTKAPVSYTNFYIGNKVVLAPTFNDKKDIEALEILQTCFPDRDIIAIDCTDIIYGGGAIHCITQQQPK
jgi:agmatine deiminase